MKNLRRSEVKGRHEAKRAATRRACEYLKTPTTQLLRACNSRPGAGCNTKIPLVQWNPLHEMTADHFPA